MDAVSQSQSSRKDADEYGEYEIIEHNGYQVKHYIQSGTLHSMPKDELIKQENKKVLKQLRELDAYINKDAPIYPEPEGDPSY